MTRAPIRVDLFSDTMTRPSDGMRRAMAEAEVGDEQQHEDPTTNRLQDMVADLLGHEAAVFVPSGTMCNEIAFAVHCSPGDEVILDQSSHPLNAEAGGPAVIARVFLRPVAGDRGVFSAAQVESMLRLPVRHAPVSRLVSVEQTANLVGGTCWSLEEIAAVCDFAHGKGLRAHCDGARIMNAVVATDTPAREFGAYFDSIWLDLSKGLGAPVGAVLAGPRDFIDEAWRWKQRLGGAMRQSGILAAAGIYALEHNVDRLVEDHENAKILAEGLAEIPGIKLDPTLVQTNIVIFEVDGGRMGAFELFQAALDDHRVRVCPLSATTVRAVTHLDVSRADVDLALAAVRSVLA
jgi:threonine aldolase